MLPALILFTASLQIVEALILVPAVAGALAAVLARTGQAAVSNWDILDFLLTGLGVVYAIILGSFTVFMMLLEQAGVMAIATAGRFSGVRSLRTAVRKFPGLVTLGFLMAVRLGLSLLPFLLLAAGTYAVLLTEQDIYFYLNVRPPVFWLAAGIGGVLLLGTLAVGTGLLVRWSFALPIMLFENLSARAALGASRDRVRGVQGRVASVLVGWYAATFAIGTVVLAGFRFLAGALLASAGENPVILTLALLLAHAALLALGSFVVAVGQSLLVRRLYLARGEQLGPPQPRALGPDSEPSPTWLRRLACAAFALVLVGPVALGIQVQRAWHAHPPVGVTAHRGHFRAAPENTLSAIRKAIESGADYAEIDVQPTADGVVVLLHDRDLKRVSGDPRRLSDLTYADVRTLDVGQWFAPAFAGERVPTLAEVMAVARGKIKLNIELKFFGPDRKLTAEVARLIRDEHFESECLVTAFDYDALQEMKRLVPGVRTGFIIAHNIGDVSGLDVDVLNVRADHLSDALLREARRRGREVHVWTVNDPRQMKIMMKRGVDNILTSDPDLLIRVRQVWQKLSAVERLVLSTRLLLGLPLEALEPEPTGTP